MQNELLEDIVKMGGSADLRAVLLWLWPRIGSDGVVTIPVRELLGYTRNVLCEYENIRVQVESEDLD